MTGSVLTTVDWVVIAGYLAPRPRHRNLLRPPGLPQYRGVLPGGPFAAMVGGGDLHRRHHVLQRYPAAGRDAGPARRDRRELVVVVYGGGSRGRRIPLCTAVATKCAPDGCGVHHVSLRGAFGSTPSDLRGALAGAVGQRRGAGVGDRRHGHDREDHAWHSQKMPW